MRIHFPVLRQTLRDAILQASLVWLCLLGAAVAGAQVATTATIQNPPTPAEPEKTTECRIPRTSEPPKIDGVLDDPCWKQAWHCSGFYRLRSNEPVAEQTEAWMCQDATHLYLAFHCLDSHPELIKAHETQREGDLSHDDIVGVAIDSQENRRNVSQFTVSARGTQQTQLEGGTADNLTWAGDWTAATHRTADGWTTEISIPFGILRYPKGAKSFGIALIRQLARETNAEIWPYIPLKGNNNPLPYLCDCKGLELPFYPPHLVAMPYVLGSVGSPSALHAGIDLKYPLSTTLTGVASLFPDFQTVEDAVQNLSFSYTEKYLPDRRPFFVEGSNFLGDPSLFYSQRIPMVDEGVKVVGKQGPTTIYALSTNAREDGGSQTSLVTSVTQDLGLYSQVGMAALSNNTAGQPANRFERVFGQYGFDHKGRDVYFYANDGESWTGSGGAAQNSYFQISTGAGSNKPYGSVSYSAIAPGFVNQLGLIPLVDLRGESMNVGQNNVYDKGRLEYTNFNVSASTYRHQTGGFLQDDVNPSFSWSLRSGWGYSFSADFNKFYPYEDNTTSASISWGQKTLFQQGSLSAQIGNEQDLPYQYYTLNQGILVSHSLSLNAALAYESLGGQVNTQSILTGTYRLNSQETFGGRIVQQNGDIDIYLSYSRRLRHGTDIFVLVGDPNSPRTRGLITIKLVRPL